jgi:Asp-tRNA(Asn)/Glu-tRNA(Gln) amidotransferase C subunit
MELTLEELRVLVANKNTRIEEIANELSRITELIEKLAATKPDESVEEMLKNAVSVANERQELATKKEVLANALNLAKQELAELSTDKTKLEVLDYLRQLREAGESCNETLEILKTQFREIRRIAAKLSTLPVQRPPLTYNYRANLPKLKILQTVLVIEEDLRSSLDAINWNV